MNIVGNRIRKRREEKGITQEVMAMELEVSQSNYGRLEKDDNRLTIPKILKIAEVLEVNIAYLFGEKATNVIHHNNGDHAQAAIGTIYSDKEHIKSLKEEIEFLRGLSRG
ncbi:MAG: XRE family transcriptional regulator [Bacteroidetes bacterium HGW-Bacteroidetes-2]|jgi:transcriptional regulator with XRE-family HTH domain|nr:MAG: XRE family transcriptional regulator [Bacteroidetes bacterium HGW-Bacteroidetes-2]